MRNQIEIEGRDQPKVYLNGQELQGVVSFDYKRGVDQPETFTFTIIVENVIVIPVKTR